MVLVQGITSNSHTVEDFAALILLRGTTKSEDVLKALTQCIVGMSLSKLVAVTTDGAPAMTRKHKCV